LAIVEPLVFSSGVTTAADYPERKLPCSSVAKIIQRTVGIKSEGADLGGIYF